MNKSFKKTIIALAMALMSACTFADTVYLKDGKVLEGTVTEAEGKITVATAEGEVVVNKDDVISITNTTPPPQPGDDPAANGDPVLDKDKPFFDTSPAGITGAYPVHDVSLPAPIVFLYMRKCLESQEATAVQKSQTQVDNWRAKSHDRERKFGGKWNAPEEIIRRRKAFNRLVAEAEEIFKLVKENPADDKEKKENTQHRSRALKKIKTAALTWGDPTLRHFLSGDCQLQNEEYAQAEQFFRRCTSIMPYVPAFWQARGIALAEMMNREIDSLNCFLKACQLDPTSPDSLGDLESAIKHVPGNRIKHPDFIKAKELAKKFNEAIEKSGGKRSSRKSSKARASYYFPSETITAEEDSLPSLPWDRFFIQRAVGVPDSPTSLLVDGKVASGAKSIFIQLPDGRIIPTLMKKSRRRSSRSRSKSNESADKLTKIFISDEYSLTPVIIPQKVEEDKKKSSRKKKNEPPPADDKTPEPLPIPVGQNVFIHSLGLYEVMGKDIRKTPAKITSADKNGIVKINGKLLPGESAGAVLLADGTLAGFLAAKTDPMVKNAGADEMIDLDEIRKIIESQKPPRRRSSSKKKEDKDEEPPEEIDGQVFKIIVVKTEKFEED